MFLSNYKKQERTPFRLLILSHCDLGSSSRLSNHFESRLVETVSSTCLIMIMKIKRYYIYW